MVRRIRDTGNTPLWCLLLLIGGLGILPLFIMCFLKSNESEEKKNEAILNMADALIDTQYTSGGATCSDYGSTLGDDYVCKANCGHNHLSPDNRIDASTCALPENTWFIEGQYHGQYFYEDYPRYQPEFEEKLRATFACLAKQGRKSVFYEELI